MPPRSLRAPAAALALALLCSAVALAGFEHPGDAGKGVKPSTVPAAGQPTSAAQTAWLNAVKAQFPALSDAEARTKANNIYQGLCKAVALVKKHDPTIGACLEDLKKKGNVCIAFNMPDDVHGVANHDGAAACSANDKINVNGAILAEGCPPAYDPRLYALATTLLHEGRHALQDYNPDTAGLDACKTTATNHKRSACNEASDGANGESKGAHVIENEWIAQIKQALDELEEEEPAADPAWSPATTQIFDEIDDLTDPARQDAIDALRDAVCAAKTSNDEIIACYLKAKMALMNFIGAEYTDETSKNAALDALRAALNDAKWKDVISDFDLPRRRVFSSADSPIVRQRSGESPADDLVTGLLGVSDLELVDTPGGRALIIAGPSPSHPGIGAIEGYIDSDGDLVFSPSEQVFHTVLFAPLNASTALDIIPPPPGAPGFFLLFDHNLARFNRMIDPDLDGLPEAVPASPVSSFLNPRDPAFVQEWRWDHAGEFLRAYECAPLSTRPSFDWNDPQLTLRDQDLNGFPEQILDPAPIYDTLLFGPVPSAALPAPADILLDVSARAGSQIAVDSLDENFIPTEILALGLVTSQSPHPFPLSRPLLPGERIQLRDLTLGTTSYVFTLPTIPGDLNGDCIVNTADLGLLIAAFGQMGFELPADLNGDTLVNTADLGLLLGAFGSACD